MEKLLSREEFKKAVFARDNHVCLFCKTPAQDAHHIMDRKLFVDGGYYLDNGASVCEKHHLECEKTNISLEEIRKEAGIDKPMLPPGLEPGEIYDKWGNPILKNGQRLKGPMFDEANVQKILQDKLAIFTHYVKYPRTPHVAWSPGKTEDEIILSNNPFLGREVIVTEKMDGENTTLYPDHMHARSLDSKHDVTRDFVKKIWSGINYQIPHGWRVCGENMYAKHSLAYQALPSYFLAFSIWNEKNTCMGWEETQEWLNLLGLSSVPVLYHGPYDEKIIKGLKLDLQKQEGYVIRDAGAFPYHEFGQRMAKFVRPAHVQTTQHWRQQAVVPNKLKP